MENEGAESGDPEMWWQFGGIPDRDKPIVHRDIAPGKVPLVRPAAGSNMQKERNGKMGSKQKKTQLGRKEQYERKLKNRLSLLAERKMEPARIDKDPLVRRLRAQVEATGVRLKAIAAIEQRVAELAKIRAEREEAEKAAKAAAPAKTGEGGKETKEKKEKAAKATAEGKEKKEKKKKEEKAG